MDKINKIPFGIELHPLTNHFSRQPNLTYSYDEISTLGRQFGSSDDLVAKEIKKLLMVTEKFIKETEAHTKALRTQNPNARKIIEKAIKEFKEILDLNKIIIDAVCSKRIDLW